MQADRLTPAQLLRLRADILDDVHAAIPDKMPWSGNICFKLEETAHKHRQEAARREAEGKVQSAATGHYENDCEELGREDSAAVPQTQTQGEREGPDSAAAADGLWVGGNPDGHGVPLSYSYAGFTLAEVRGVLAEAKHVLSAARLKPFLPLLKETT